ncbi:hypothetical protein NXS19_004599 [Fusarium pseudograminearum]|nr:hypothetical protein NXS19_004599 [Fusarium pseudograminearum]
MYLHVRYFASIAALLGTITTTSAVSLQPSDCMGKVTEFSNCDNIDRILKKCNLITGKQESIDCFCTQEVLDSYVGCKGEARQCMLSNDFDNSLDKEIANWQDACGPYLSNDITTRSIVQPTRTFDKDFCQTVAQKCYRLNEATEDCSTSYTKGADFTSCRCESSMISLASVCEIDGSMSCYGEMPITSNIWEFQNCAATAAPTLTDPSESADQLTTTLKSTKSTDGSSYVFDFEPSLTATTTSSNNAASKHYVARSIWTWIVFVLGLVIS